MATKTEIRKNAKAARNQLSLEEVDKLSAKIAHLLFSRIPIHRYSVVHVFLPILKNKEPNTYLILEKLFTDFPVEVYLSKSLENGEMLHVPYLSDTVLEKNQWGIPEPQNLDSAIDSTTFFEKYKKEDILVLIPLLAFDQFGNRIGYGKGYYDRFLSYSGKNTTKVGISLFNALDTDIESELTDIRMDLCITPEKIYNWNF